MTDTASTLPLDPSGWARALTAAPNARVFAATLCRLTLDYARGHGARMTLVPEGGPDVLAEEGRGLALLRDELARDAMAEGEARFQGSVCALPIGEGVLEVVGGDEEALRALCGWLPLVGLALEGVRARDARRGRGRTAEVVENLVRRLGGSLDLGEVLTATAESAARALNFERAFVGLFDEIRENTARLGEVFTFGFDHPLDGSIGVGPMSFERLVRRREPILYDRVRDELSPLAQGLADLAPERCVILPLNARGRTLGILYIDTKRPGMPLGDDDVWLALALAEQASLAIDNARLYEDESRKRRAAEALREAGSSLAGSLRLAETLEKLLEHAQKLFRATACAVYELQPDGRDLKIRSALGLASEYVLRARARVGVGVVGRAVARSERVVVHDMRAERVEVGSRYTRMLLASGKYPYQALVGLPLGGRGRPFGGLVLYFEGPLELDENDLSLAEVFAAQATLAIENARLYEEEVRRERESNVLLHLSRLLGGRREDGALDEATEKAMLALGAERGLILLIDEAGEPSELSTFQLQATPEQAHRFASQLGRGPRRLTRRAALPGAGSAVVMPLRSGSTLIGMLYADHSREEAPSDRVLQLARAIGDQIALTLGQERLLAALEREEARYRLLAEGAHDLIIACEASGIITYANPATVRVLGHLEGGSLWKLLGEDWHFILERAWGDCLADPDRGVTCEVEIGGLHRVLRLEMRLSAVVREREVLGVLLVARDLSEQQQLAEEIARRGQQLEAASARQLELRSYLSLFTQAQEEERKRISRELHDDTAQVLVAIGRRLDRLTKMLTDEPRTQAEEVRADLNAAIESVRRFARNLRPSVLDDLGLLPALEWLASQARTPARLEVQGQERRLQSTVELTVFRLVQEALTNVDKHARAQSAAVRVQFSESEVSVTVSDDGAGFDIHEASDLASRGHLGLMGLRERVHLAGGELEVTSAAGVGTSLRFTLPA